MMSTISLCLKVSRVCRSAHTRSRAANRWCVAQTRRSWFCSRDGANQFVLVFLLLALALPSIGIVAIVAWEWHDRPSQRGWLILGFAFYIFTALQAVWAMFMRVCEQLWHLRIQVRSVVSKTLFEAVSQAIAQASDRQSSTCSRDQEAVLEADKLTGDLKVVCRLWSSQPSSFRVRVSVSPADTNHTGGTLFMEVRYSPGNEVVCGRDSRVQRAEVLELSIRTSS